MIALKYKRLNKEGAISIIYLIMIFIAVIIMMGFVNMTNKTIAINEVQGIMDTTGVMALRKSVDENAWRDEVLYVDKSHARNEFVKLVNRSIGEYIGEDKLLSGFELQSVRVFKGSETAMGNIQNTSKDQYYLEGVGIATYSTYGFVDQVMFHGINYFDFLNIGENSSVAVGGTREDGKVEVIVRTVSRLALR